MQLPEQLSFATALYDAMLVEDVFGDEWLLRTGKHVKSELELFMSGLRSMVWDRLRHRQAALWKMKDGGDKALREDWESKSKCFLY